MKDVLVTGGSGQVGGALLALAPEGGFRFVGLDRSELDLLNPSSFAQVISARPWSAIINAAAYTAVDQAETEVEAAWRINAVAPACLAREAARAGVPFVHVSTDYVFSGASTRPYAESDPVAPLGVYGASKEAGEQGVRTGGGRSAIVRTSWVVSPSRANFLKTMLRLGADRDVLRVVADQHGAPTSAADLASALALIARALAQIQTRLRERFISPMRELRPGPTLRKRSSACRQPEGVQARALSPSRLRNIPPLPDVPPIRSFRPPESRRRMACRRGAGRLRSQISSTISFH